MSSSMPSPTSTAPTPEGYGESDRGTATRRRRPRQARSRERVERVLDAACELVVAHGIDGISTRSIAARAELPVASLYQYFSDKEAVLLAICERDMAEMDDQVATDIAALDELTITSLVETAMRAFVKVYHRRPAFMQIWMRGRTNVAVYDYGRHHNQRIATDLLAVANEAGLVEATRFTTDELAAIAELAVELGDRAFQLAFEHDPRGKTFLIDQAIDVVTGYLERINNSQ
ncbi:MAG: TetR/AcrR family transcriptional regulator [Nocardioidaceae bacterium]|nr:TetR/AcrR family transcriptional regulator [Nocardioidaceae bacterium]